MDAARTIRSGLGAPSERAGAVTREVLASATHLLVIEAAHVDSDELLRRAHSTRDDLDEAGIADRERAAFEERSERGTRRPSGLPECIVDSDIESAAFWDDVYDTLPPPRCGGARFVDDADKAWTEGISSDERTTDHYVHDTFTQLLGIAVSPETDESGHIVGSRQPAVRVLITRTALEARQSHGRIEGGEIPISLGTVEALPANPARCRSTSSNWVAPSISAASSGFTHNDNGSRSPPRRAGACSGTVIGHPVGARCIMQNIGNGITARPTSLTGYCCAYISTCLFITTAGRSCEMTRDFG